MNKIYFDCDGVLANFEKAIVQHVGTHYWDRTTDKYWHVLENVPELYYSLDILPGSLEMFYKVMATHGTDVVEILTGAPQPTGLLATACEDKVRWFHDYVHPTVKVNTVIGGKNKWKWLEENPGTVLIDDYHRNILQWIEHGGIGILHTDPGSTLEKLKILGLLHPKA